MLNGSEQPGPQLLTPQWRGDILALVLGLLMPLAFSPFDLPLIALLSITGLFLLWQKSSTKRACWRGWLFGFGMFSVGVYWVYHSMHVYGHVATPVAIFLTLLLAAFLAIYPALAAWPFFLKTSRTKSASQNDKTLVTLMSPGFFLLLWYPLAWTFFEWVRSWLLTGFPWLNIGYSQTGWPLGGLAAIIGVYGISWMLCLSAGLLSMFIIQKDKRRFQYASAFILLWAVSWLAGMIEWTEPVGKELKVSLVQGNVDQESKWSSSQRQQIIQSYVDVTRQLWDSDLVIWPETAVPTFYQDMEYGFIRSIEKEARENNTDLLAGMPAWAEDGDGYFNSMVALGEKRGLYYKRHLVPFGEYIPFKKYLQDLMAVLNAPMVGFSSGDASQPLLQAVGYKLGILICYEIAFGEEVIQQLPEAAFLVNASNNAWFGDSTAPHQILQMARMRALETGRYVLSVTNNGMTAIVNHKGEVLDIAPQFQKAVLTGNVQPRKGSTLYVRFGNYPVVGLMLVLLIIGWRVSKNG